MEDLRVLEKFAYRVIAEKLGEFIQSDEALEAAASVETMRGFPFKYLEIKRKGKQNLENILSAIMDLAELAWIKRPFMDETRITWRKHPFIRLTDNGFEIACVLAYEVNKVSQQLPPAQDFEANYQFSIGEPESEQKQEVNSQNRPPFLVPNTTNGNWTLHIPKDVKSFEVKYL